jgi:cell division septation protein DedD
MALLVVLAIVGAGCSREQQDWRSAESAATSEAWAHFVEQHPESELAAQARDRIAQLAEQREWQRADSLASADAYREFVARHPTGKWSEEARIRIEAFALGSAPRIAPQTAEQAAAHQASGGVRALPLAAAAPVPSPEGSDATAPAPPQLAQAGEPAQPPSSALPAAPAGPGEGAAPAPASYGVQLGAFGSQESAQGEWQRLQGRFGTQLGGLAPRIVMASTDSGTLYRLQASAAGEAEARAICNSLKEQAQACVPVLPR